VRRNIMSMLVSKKPITVTSTARKSSESFSYKCPFPSEIGENLVKAREMVVAADDQFFSISKTRRDVKNNFGKNQRLVVKYSMR
jgi:hypothetical protein